MQHAVPSATVSEDAVRASMLQIIAPQYRQALLSMIEDLEKRKPEAIDWFRNDLEDVGLVATAAGFRPESVYRAISYPLREGRLDEVLKRIARVRETLANEG